MFLFFAHTYFSVINYGFLIKVIICVPARSTDPTHGFWTDVCLGKLRNQLTFLSWGFHGVWGGVGGDWVMIVFFRLKSTDRSWWSIQQDESQKCTTFNAKPARRPQINPNFGASPSLAWIQREPGAWWTDAANARTFQLLQFERWRPSWSDQLCRQEKCWISPGIVPLIGETWHWSGYIANCFDKRNWEVVQSQTGWRNMVLYLSEENPRRFVREIFAGYGNSHSSILMPNKPWRKPAPRSKVSWPFPSIASFAMLLEVKNIQISLEVLDWIPCFYFVKKSTTHNWKI